MRTHDPGRVGRDVQTGYMHVYDVGTGSSFALLVALQKKTSPWRFKDGLFLIRDRSAGPVQ